MELNPDPEPKANFEAGWSENHVVNDDNDEWSDTTKEEFSSSLDWIESNANSTRVLIPKSRSSESSIMHWSKNTIKTTISVAMIYYILLFLKFQILTPMMPTTTKVKTVAVLKRMEKSILVL